MVTTFVIEETTDYVLVKDVGTPNPGFETTVDLIVSGFPGNQLGSIVTVIVEISTNYPAALDHVTLLFRGPDDTDYRILISSNILSGTNTFAFDYPTTGPGVIDGTWSLYASMEDAVPEGTIVTVENTRLEIESDEPEQVEITPAFELDLVRVRETDTSEVGELIPWDIERIPSTAPNTSFLQDELTIQIQSTDPTISQPTISQIVLPEGVNKVSFFANLLSPGTCLIGIQELIYNVSDSETQNVIEAPVITTTNTKQLFPSPLF